MNIYSLALLLLIQSLSCNQALESLQASYPPDSVQQQNSDKDGVANIVFKSMDGGQTWQDISDGLPETLEEGGFFANESGLYLGAGTETYHSKPNSKAPFWKKMFPGSQPPYLGEHSSIAAGKSGISANNYWGVHLNTTNGTSVWSPIFDNNLSEPRMRSVFETAGGSIFIGTDRGLFKTADDGKTWKHVYAGGWAGNFAESDGVLLSTSIRRIIRSTDDGETWELVSEGGVTWDVKQVKAGFAAISSSSASDTRTLRTSSDGGKTWQPPSDRVIRAGTDAGPHDKVFIKSLWQTWNDRRRVQAFQTSIIQVGENFFGAHPGGIYRSSDNGQTWKLVLPSVEDKVFNLFISGNVIYAVPSKGGC